MIKKIRECPRCKHLGYDKGRAVDGRRAYRCQKCGETWSEGWQGMSKQRFYKQREGYQFANTGACKK